jgi:hypothetical protein
LARDFIEVGDEHDAALLKLAAEIRSFKRHTDTDLDRIAEAKMRFFTQSPKHSLAAPQASES